MMRLILGGLFVAAFACPAIAQVEWGSRGSFPGCPQCGVWSWVDKPDDQITVSTRGFVLQGWGFECVSGMPADRVNVYWQDYDGDWWPLLLPDYALESGQSHRSDVERFARTIGCRNVGSDTGWALRVSGVPLGLRRLKIDVWRGPYFETHYRTYLIRQ